MHNVLRVMTQRGFVSPSKHCFATPWQVQLEQEKQLDNMYLGSVSHVVFMSHWKEKEQVDRLMQFEKAGSIFTHQFKDSRGQIWDMFSLLLIILYRIWHTYDIPVIQPGGNMNWTICVFLKLKHRNNVIFLLVLLLGRMHAAKLIPSSCLKEGPAGMSERR